MPDDENVDPLNPADADADAVEEDEDEDEGADGGDTAEVAA